MAHLLIKKLGLGDRLTEGERGLIEAMSASTRRCEPGEVIAEEGASPDTSCLILEGWATRSKTLSDGRRQITAFHIAGDFVDLHSFLMKPMDHTVTALTEARLALVPHSTLRRITEEHPHLTRVLWHSTLIDAAIHREWMVALGRLAAWRRLARLICELFLRLDSVGLAQDMSFDFPITQLGLADALGITGVHVNRTIQDLRRRGLIAWLGSRVTLKDFAGLQEVAEFDPTYLNLTARPG
jgi:CRP-like cAMP-binding protein